MHFLDKLEAVRNTQQDIVKRFIEVLREGLEPLFDKHLNVKTVSWEQYTPYFNDGSICEFNADVDYVKLNRGLGDLEREVTDDVQDEFSEVTNQFENDEYKLMFGDHCRVTVSRGGITVEEYDHE